jgi:acetylornithine deacetylase
MKGPSYSATELLARLVSFDTTSHKSNMSLVRFVEDYLAQRGVASQLVVNPEGTKANLFATVRIGPAIRLCLRNATGGSMGAAPAT